ncbi:hypothetical protein [Streptomyces sp. NPDC059398]|uniref:hypothetical protein n=1 Tax=Streptomyces sp. NPDC059398 TaxID=3346820 RepID=UPI0036BD2584
MRITEAGSLEVISDIRHWPMGHGKLNWHAVQRAFQEMVPAISDVLMPWALKAVVGPATLSPPIVEIHIATHSAGARSGQLAVPVDEVIDTTNLGTKASSGHAYGGGEVLDETLIKDGNWSPAVIEALTAMAMDWKYPSPCMTSRRRWDPPE